MTHSFFERLLYRFRKQEEFTRDYSPLYAAEFGAVGDWLEFKPDDPLAAWLLDAVNGRTAFDAPILLLAGLHRDVLLGAEGTAVLSSYYPSVTDMALPADKSDKVFRQAFYEAVMARRDSLAEFIQTQTVQTNETGRGIIWLLPVSMTPWKRMHLVDLGASAGLNLVAEQRAFRFFDENGRFQHDLGQGQPVQFQINARGKGPDWERLANPGPQIISRIGCDLRPFPLATKLDQQTLAAFIWPDQTARMLRLREGIAAWRNIQTTAVPVQLFAANLPDDLPGFLQKHIPESSHPVVLYNTFITMYLAERDAALRTHIAAWAENQPRPVLWLQWEPPSNLGINVGSEPEFGWLLWTADLWQNGRHQRWLLGWIHPHGHTGQWLPGIQEWQVYHNA